MLTHWTATTPTGSTATAATATGWTTTSATRTATRSTAHLEEMFGKLPLSGALVTAVPLAASCDRGHAMAVQQMYGWIRQGGVTGRKELGGSDT